MKRARFVTRPESPTLRDDFDRSGMYAGLGRFEPLSQERAQRAAEQVKSELQGIAARALARQGDLHGQTR